MIQNRPIQVYKPVSLDIIKLLFFHFFFAEKSAGVNRVIENNIKGLKLFYPGLESIFAAGEFDKGIFDKYEKRFINLNSGKFFQHLSARRIKKDLENITSDVEIVSGHNLLRGIYPHVIEGFRDFSEISGKVREFRNHDFVLRYPKAHREIIRYFNEFKNMFPRNPEVIQTTLTTSTRSDMEIFFGGDIELMRNSVVCEELYPKNDGKDEKLKELFLEEGIFEDGMKHVIYAVRADERKNVEEALFITSILSHISGKPHKLVLTLGPNNDAQKAYTKEVQEFASAWNIPFSVGEASKYLKDEQFNVGNLYRAGDVAITTAFKEGFGYAFVEPWVSFANSESKEKYVIGRIVREVCEDFERNGMVLGNVNKNGEKIGQIFYDSSMLYSKGSPEGRMKYFGGILGDKGKLRDFVKRIGLEKRIDFSKEYLEHNAKIVKEVYGHDVVAKELAQLYGLPNSENIRLAA